MLVHSILFFFSHLASSHSIRTYSPNEMCLCKLDHVPQDFRQGEALAFCMRCNIQLLPDTDLDICLISSPHGKVSLSYGEKEFTLI